MSVPKSMLLTNAIFTMMTEEGIDIEDLDNIEYNCGSVTFDDTLTDTSYCISIMETEE